MKVILRLYAINQFSILKIVIHHLRVLNCILRSLVKQVYALLFVVNQIQYRNTKYDSLTIRSLVFVVTIDVTLVNAN